VAGLFDRRRHPVTVFAQQRASPGLGAEVRLVSADRSRGARRDAQRVTGWRGVGEAAVAARAGQRPGIGDELIPSIHLACVDLARIDLTCVHFTGVGLTCVHPRVDFTRVGRACVVSGGRTGVIGNA
jgi:hypothetical protein